MNRKKIKTVLTLLITVLFTQINYAQTVTIGNQVWMTKNLHVSTFRNGDPIPQAKTDAEWKLASENSQPAWCYYENDLSNGEKYGILYNWYAVNDPRGLAPEGFHIPSSSELVELSNFLGYNAGHKMKSSDIFETKVYYREEGGYYEQKYMSCQNCSYWTNEQKKYNPCPKCKNKGHYYISTGKYIPKTKRKVEEKILIGGWNGDNSSGFTGLHGGYRLDEGNFNSSGPYGFWWSTSSFSSVSAYYYSLSNDLDKLSIVFCTKGFGCSVRCIKD
jgi:uncharacterized protein (TIGR02145 family)